MATPTIVTGLRGNTVEGGFPNERVVRVRDFEGNLVTTIVGADHVTDSSNGDVLIHVRVVDGDDRRVLVQIPGELLNGGPFITVLRADLSPVTR